MVNLYLTKRLSRGRRLTRKERFKKNTGGGDLLLKKIFQKDPLFRLNTHDYLTHIKNKKKIKFFKVKRYKRIKKQLVCLNFPKLVYTKKSLGVRMGKGKGGGKKWSVKLTAGMPIITLNNWSAPKAYRVLGLLKKLLPGKFYVYFTKIYNRQTGKIRSL